MSKRITDVLSGLKSAASTPLGKVIGGLGLTAAAGHFGGAQGMQALGGVVDKIQQRRDLTKLQEAKDAMAGEPENMTEWKLKNTRAVEPDFEDAVNRTTGNKRSGGSGSVPKVTPFPMTGPQSTDPNEIAMPDGEDKDNQLLKNLQRVQIDGSKFGADFVQRAGLQNAGIEALKEYRGQLKDELKAAGLSREQLESAWREITRQIAPDHYQQSAEMAGGELPNMLLDDLAESSLVGAAQTSGMATGAVAGAKAGSAILPGYGTLIGAMGGGLMGYAGTDWLTSVEGHNVVSGMANEAMQYISSSLGGGNSNAGNDTTEPRVVKPRTIGPDDQARFEPGAGLNSYQADRQRRRRPSSGPREQTMTGDAPSDAVVDMSLYNDNDYIAEQRRKQQEMMRNAHLLR